MTLDPNAPELDPNTMPAQSEPDDDAAEQTAKVSDRDAIADALDRLERGEQPAGRDSTGKFTKAAKAEEGAEQSGDQPAAVDTPDAPQMPKSWGAKRAAVWDQIPPEARAVVAQREAEMARGVERFRDLTPYAEMAEKNGLSLSAVLSNYVQAEQKLAQDPVEGLRHICQKLGFDPVQVGKKLAGEAARAGEPQVPEYRDPRVDDLIAERQREAERARRDEFSRVEKETKAFFDDKKTYPYASDVADVMAKWILERRKLGDEPTLRSAYEAAIWLHPDTREKLISERSASTVSTTAKAATRAASASKSLNGLSPNAPGRTKQLTSRQAVEAAYDQLEGRG